MNKNSRRILFHLTLFISLGLNLSCSTNKELSSLIKTKSNCYNQADYEYTIADMPTAFSMDNLDMNLNREFSFKALNIANAFGFLDLLKSYSELKIRYQTNASIENKLNLIELKLHIIQKINSSSLEISSVTSELDCEEERADQIANFLKGKMEEKEKKLVIGSIIVGAAGAIIVEGLNNNAPDEKTGSYVAVATALTEATLGVLMLTNKKKIQFLHNRNTLGEIWDNPATSTTLPASIWYYLNYKNPNNQESTLRELLVEHWETFGQVGKNSKNKNPEIDEIYFGAGGLYSSEELSNRADMYDQIEAYINLMKQDLKTLSDEFGRFSVN